MGEVGVLKRMKRLCRVPDTSQHRYAKWMNTGHFMGDLPSGNSTCCYLERAIIDMYNFIVALHISKVVVFHSYSLGYC